MSATTTATGTSSYVAPPTAGIERLEHFLNDILKVELMKVLAERDVVRDQASQCVQARQLFRDMAHLRNSKHINNNSHRLAAAATEAGDDGKTGAAAVATSKQRKKEVAEKNLLLVNLGNHFYVPAVVKDADRVHVNIGCGVVLAMTTEEAEQFLEKREKQLRAKAQWKTRESLKLKYRIKLVTEAIKRLNERTMGISK